MRSFLLALLVSCVLVPYARAGTLERAKISLHVAQLPTKNPCVTVSEGGEALELPCSELRTSAALGIRTIYLLATQADSGEGFSSVSCGIRYSPGLLALLDIPQWRSCGTTTTYGDGAWDQTWPMNDTGVRVDWDPCATMLPPGYPSDGAFSIAGVITVNPMAPGWIEIIPNPQDPDGATLEVADCTGEITQLPPESAAKVRVSTAGDEAGYNPCSPTPDPVCAVTPHRVDFGPVYIPGSRDSVITVVNNGSIPLQGAVSIQRGSYYPTQDFHLRSGVQNFLLAPGARMDLQIEYIPTNHPARSVLRLGADCPMVELLGRGVVGLAIHPSSIDFGNVPPGVTVQESIRVTNICPVPLTLNAGGPEAPFRISGPRRATLDPGGSADFVVEFYSETGGTFSSSFSAAPYTVSTELHASVDTWCRVEPSALDFGIVEVGEAVDTTLTLFNEGDYPITGTISLDWNPEGGFSILEGAGPYALDPGGFKSFVLRYRPSLERTYRVDVDLGTSCPGVPCRGTGWSPCRRSDLLLQFGLVPPGETRTKGVYLTNISGHPIEGLVRFQGDHRISLTSGEGEFRLEPGEVHAVLLTFQASTSAAAQGVLSTGIKCGNIQVYGVVGTVKPASRSRLAVHLAPVGDVSPCGTAVGTPVELPCGSLLHTGRAVSATGYELYLVATEVDPAGILGVDFGIAYNGDPQRGVDVFRWTTCSELEFKSDGWPASGTANVLTWDHASRCEPGDYSPDSDTVNEILGSFYVYAYSSDLFRITPRYFAATSSPTIMDCSLTEAAIGPQGCGYAAFSPELTLSGCNPCVERCREQGPLIAAIPGWVNFGAREIGAVADTVIQVLNVSTSRVSGSAAVTPGAFSLVGESSFDLDPGALQDVHVRFAATQPGVLEGSLGLTGATHAVELVAVGVTPDSGGSASQLPLVTQIRRRPGREMELQVSGTAWRTLREADIAVFNIQGQLVHQDRLHAEGETATYRWSGLAANGRRVSSGIYYVRVRVGSYVRSASIVLLP